MGPEEVGVRLFTDPSVQAQEQVALSEEMRGKIERGVREILEHERARAKQILGEQKALIVAMRDLLLEKKVIDRTALAELTGKEPRRG
jgi:cell division protease FtsH